MAYNSGVSGLRVAVVGFGYWGKNLIRNFNDLGVLSAICDVDAMRAADAAKQYPTARFFSSEEELFAFGEFDAVAIATPAATHFKVARTALLADKHVFVEKPLALHLAQGEELCALADRMRRTLMVGHVLQYHPAVHALRNLIAAGELGKIEYVYSNRLNIGKLRTEENILWSFAPHDISVMLGLLGEEPSQIDCQGANWLSQGVADTTMSQFTFPSGVHAHIFVSWLHPFKEQRLVVVGNKKMAVFDDAAEDKLLLYPHEVQWKNRIPTAVKASAEKVSLPEGEPLKNECQHFIECCKAGTTPQTDGREGVRVLKVLAACEAALRARHEKPAPKVASPSYFAHESAWIDAGCTIGAGTKIWHACHVMERARIGADCSFGQNCFIASDVVVGDRVKVQNNVSLYTGVYIEDDVFLGPSCVFTNVTNPRSQIDRRSLYESTRVKRGASIGANATIRCGVEIGRYAFVGAGAVVTKNVPDYALVVGVPAEQVGWMSRHGQRLELLQRDSDVMICPESGLRYREIQPGVLRCMDVDEEAPLPANQRIGKMMPERPTKAHP